MNALWYYFLLTVLMTAWAIGLVIMTALLCAGFILREVGTQLAAYGYYIRDWFDDIGDAFDRTYNNRKN